MCFTLFASSVIGGDEDAFIEEMLRTSPKERVERAVSIGDTRYMSTPRCSEMPPMLAVDLLPEGGDLAIDANCQVVYGREGLARLQKLGQYADEYNRLMLDYVTKNGLFTIYPRNAKRYESANESEKLDAANNAKRLVSQLFGDPLPSSINIDGQTLWKESRFRVTLRPNERGGNETLDSRLFVQLKVSKADFNVRFRRGEWREIPIPWEVIRPMHLPPGAPREYMSCFLGKVGTSPAYVFWSEYHESMMVVVALSEPSRASFYPRFTPQIKSGAVK